MHLGIQGEPTKHENNLDELAAKKTDAENKKLDKLKSDPENYFKN